MNIFNAIGNLLGVLSPIHIIYYTMSRGGKRVGVDQQGNRYFRGKARKGYKRERRWVMYKGTPEASKVPPEWHGWLHYQTDEVPQEKNGYRRKWQQPHLPNMTGTLQAYRPPGHLLKTGQREKATGDYEAWTPKD